MGKPANAKIKKKKEQYSSRDMEIAVSMVKEGNCSVYKAAKQYNIPWSTLKNYVKRYEDDQSNTNLKKNGRPFALPSDLEVKLVAYITTMQQIGFGLTATQVRRTAFRLAESKGILTSFNKDEKLAGWHWWRKFRQRYNLCMRTPENLSINRAAMATRENFDDFYDKLQELKKKLNIVDQPDRLWNVDETGLSYVLKSGKVVASVGSRYVYKQANGEKGVTTTVVGCICANGLSIPPMVIFKGKRMNEKLRQCPFPALLKLSPKGWINSELFVEWFTHFINIIPKPRPVILLMDSHASHVTPEILSLAAENEIHLMTFPAHTTHLLQPLDVGVYKPLKDGWREQLNKFMNENPGEKPDRYHFTTFLAEAYKAAFQTTIAMSAFSKCGISPFNRMAVPDEALAPSKAVLLPAANETLTEEEILAIPKPKATKQSKPKKVNLAKILALPQKPTSHGNQPRAGPSNVKIPKKNVKNFEDCYKCGGTFNADVEHKNGAEWIQCQFCKHWYHVNCQNVLDEKYFMCSYCEESD